MHLAVISVKNFLKRLWIKHSVLLICCSVFVRGNVHSKWHNFFFQSIAETLAIRKWNTIYSFFECLYLVMSLWRMLETKSEILRLLFVETFKYVRRNAAAGVLEVQNNYYRFLCCISVEFQYYLTELPCPWDGHPNAIMVLFLIPLAISLSTASVLEWDRGDWNSSPSMMCWCWASWIMVCMSIGSFVLFCFLGVIQ